jgi:hypothetical protein
VSEASPAPRRAARVVVAGVLLVLAVGWAVLIHHGLGPRPDLALYWWSPRGFLRRALLGSPLEPWLLERGARAFLLFWLPSLALAGAVWLATRSSLARALALTASIATAVFLFFALGSETAHLAWNLFHWRLSATMLATAAAIGAVLASPWLARSWLRLGWPARLAWFLPVAFVVVAIERGVTGTNPRLPFAISPWPALQVFALEVVGSIVAALLAGVALCAHGLARVRAPRRPGEARPRLALGLLAVALGLALPAAWLALGGQGVLPFRPEPRSFVIVTGLCALAAAIVALPNADPWRLRGRARALGAAALLVGVPLLVGEIWSRVDYTRNRDVHAQRVIDALARHYEREQIYPESLDQLVDAGDLDAVPRPRIGFRFLDQSEAFTYQGFGTSYLLEFAAPRWVQCAYNPPYGDEGEREADDEAAERGERNDAEQAEWDDEALAGAWSCPSSPPELW